MDGGFDTVTTVLMDNLKMEDFINKHASIYDSTDYKTKLQESVNMNRTDIVYEIYDMTGPAHDCTYFASVTIFAKDSKDKNSAKGKGRSKKDAEQSAAKELLKKLGLINGEV